MTPGRTSSGGPPTATTLHIKLAERRPHCRSVSIAAPGINSGITVGPRRHSTIFCRAPPGHCRSRDLAGNPPARSVLRSLSFFGGFFFTPAVVADQRALFLIRVLLSPCDPLAAREPYERNYNLSYRILYNVPLVCSSSLHRRYWLQLYQGFRALRPRSVFRVCCIYMVAVGVPNTSGVPSASPGQAFLPTGKSALPVRPDDRL